MADWLIDGQPDARLAPDDRGVLFGDGLFETIVFHHGRAALWPLHMQRLARGCRDLGLPPPDPRQLADEAEALVKGHAHAVVRLALTRGRGGAGYRPPAEVRPTRILIRREVPHDLARRRAGGIDMKTSPYRLEPAAGLGGLKHSSRLEQVMIARTLDGADEALVLDRDGRIVEALHANIVVVREGRLLAPSHPAAVAGVGLAWLGREFGEALERIALQAGALRAADSLWVINSVHGPCPVARLDGRILARDEQFAAVLQAWQEKVEK